VLMLFRQGALVILAGMMPLAAAGTLTPGTRSWFKRVAGWELALIFYKPAAALVYATAFTLIGTGKSVQAILTGFAMVVMSLLALPVLMRFFTWTTGQVADSAAGGGFLQTALSGAVAVGALRGSSGGFGGSGAAEQARLVSAQLGPSGGPSGAQAPGAGVRQPAAPPGPGTAAPGAGASGMPAGASAASAGAGAASRTAAGASGAAAGGGAGAGAAGVSAAGAGGPAGVAAAGLAAGARSAGRKATEAMQPPQGAGGGQS